MSAPLRVALVGCAGLGKQNHQRDMYAPAFAAHPGFSIVAATGPGCQELAGQFGVPYQEELIPADVDVLSVCVPLDQRVDVVLAGSAAGAHILCDKPVSIDPAAAQRVSATERVFLPAHHQRFNASIRSAQAAVAAGRVGLPWSIHADFLVAGGEPVAENELLNFGAYPVDVVHFLTGQEIHRVHAYSTPDRSMSTLLLDHSHGLMSAITVGRCQSSRFIHRYRISGSHGMLMVDATKPHLDVDTPTGTTRAWPGGDTVAALVNELYESIRDGRTAIPGAADAVRVARVLDAAGKSLRTGRPVELNAEAL